MPFAYNGTDSLLADFSFNNGTYSLNGLCRSTLTPDKRSLYAQTDSAFGDPLAWNGTNRPAPVAANRIPNARFTLEDAVRAAPTGMVQVVSGLWMGPFTIFDPGSNLVLRAFDGLGRIATSVPFAVDSAEDADGDGLPDAWKRRFFGSATVAPGDDADGDGISNRDEYLAGTNPIDASSATRIVSVHIERDDVCLFFASVAGKAYRVECSDQMGAASWTTVKDHLPGNGGIVEVRHVGAAGAANRFYRVQVRP